MKKDDLDLLIAKIDSEISKAIADERKRLAGLIRENMEVECDKEDCHCRDTNIGMESSASLVENNK